MRSNLAITIAPAAGSSDLKLRASITQPVKKGVPISGAMVAQGGTAPYIFSEVTGNLAAFGITLNADGTLTGSPTTVGLVTFLAKVQDAALGVFTATFSIRVHANLKVVAGDPPDGEKAQTDYSYRFAISGATGAVTWSISPSLSFGHSLYLDPSTGVLDTGGGAIVGSTGTLNFTVTAADAGSGDSLDIPCSIVIYSELKAKLVAARQSIIVGIPTTITSSAQGWQGGAAPFAIRFDSTTFPSGLSVQSVDPTNGTITVLATAPFAETLVFSAGDAVVTDSLGLETNMLGTRLRAVSAVQPQSDGSDTGDFGISHLNVVGMEATSVDGVMTIDGGIRPFAVASGTDNYTATVPGLTAYTAGYTINVLFPNQSTPGHDISINLSGLGPKALLVSGMSVSAYWAATGRAMCIPANSVQTLAYDGAAFHAP